MKQDKIGYMLADFADRATREQENVVENLQYHHAEISRAVEIAIAQRFEAFAYMISEQPGLNPFTEKQLEVLLDYDGNIIEDVLIYEFNHSLDKQDAPINIFNFKEMSRYVLEFADSLEARKAPKEFEIGYQQNNGQNIFSIKIEGTEFAIPADNKQYKAFEARIEDQFLAKEFIARGIASHNGIQEGADVLVFNPTELMKIDCQGVASYIKHANICEAEIRLAMQGYTKEPYFKEEDYEYEK